MTSAELQARKAEARDKKRFVLMTYDGTSCTVRPSEVADLIDGNDEGYTFTDIWMTEDEFEALPEFSGW